MTRARVPSDAQLNKSAPSSNFQNARSALYYYIGRDAETEGDWIKLRYDDKCEWYKKHYVSIIIDIDLYHNDKTGTKLITPNFIPQEEEREQRGSVPVTWDQEVAIYYKYSKKPRNLQRKCGKRTQVNFDESRGLPVDTIVVMDAIDRLRLLGYNEPVALQAGIFERYVAMVIDIHMQTKYATEFFTH